MLVIKLIGFILIALLIYWIMIEINRYSYKQYKYDFFNMQNFVSTAIGYILLYFGNRWYASALKSGGDLLNGQIIIGIGTLFIFYVVYLNIKKTSFIFGLFFTGFQLLLYIGLSFIAFLVLVIGAAALSETKPVYVLNND